VYWRPNNVRNQPEIGGVVDGHRIRQNRRVERNLVESVLGGMIRDDDSGQNFRNIVLGLAGKVITLVELPEIGVSGLLNRALHVAGAPVVSGHGEIPVAELRV